MMKVLVIALLAAAAVADEQWSPSWTSGAFSFEWSSLCLSEDGMFSKSYSAQVGTSTNYTYQFDMCGTLGNNSIPELCAFTLDGRHGDGCVHTDGTPATCHGTWAASAFQYESNGGNCHRIGGRAGDPESRSFALLDQHNPAAGFQVTFTKGDRGSGGASITDCPHQARQFTVQVPCGSDSDVETYVSEKFHELQPQCEYTLKLPPSAAGCPGQCMAIDGQVCGGPTRGYCDVDSDLAEARCFCMSGFYGKGCENEGGEKGFASTKNASACDGTCVGLVFVFLFLLVGLIGVGVVFWRVRGLEKVDKNFRKLQEDFDVNDAGPVDLRGHLN